MKLAASGLTGLLFLSACGGNDTPPPIAKAALPQGIAARVGSDLIGVGTVSRVAERQGVAPPAALDLAVSDALFAEGARATLAPGATRSIVRAATARSVLEQLSAAAIEAGPATQRELDDIVQQRWLELDRPDAVRVTHAVVLNDKAERDTEARALAEKLADELRNVATGDELIRLTNALPKAGFEIRAEELPFVTTDGRTFQRRDAGFVARPETFDRDFAHAANQLQRVGQISSVVKSSFGYHVMFLEERLPGLTVAKAQLPDALRAEVMRVRGDRARKELLEKLHQSAPIQSDRAIDELMAQVKAAP